MHRARVLMVALVVFGAACGTDVAAPTAAGTAAPSDISTTPVQGQQAGGSDAPAPTAPDADDGPPAGDSPGDTPETPSDTPPSGDAGSAPPPAEQAQSCTAWQDCGPNFGDLNSGFDCDDGQCACNVEGTYDDDCRAIGGVWSDEECFCFVTQSRPPEPANDDTPADDEPYCWWRWYEECEPDEWVDRSYYRRICDDTGCYDRYTRDGYWRSGDCNDVWIKRCDDGSEYEYR